VVLADAAPQLPDERRGADDRDQIGARDLDPLGQIGGVVRDLRDTRLGEGPVRSDARTVPKPVWPTGLAVDVALGIAALWLTARRLRTPSRTLPKGQRVA
jgi:hypothetical protein